jgi:transcriptional regulator with XRE-family HTH domain
MITAADLIAFRARFDLTREQLARALGVPCSSLARWERGARPIPKPVGLTVAWIRACCREIEEELGGATVGGRGRTIVGA